MPKVELKDLADVSILRSIWKRPIRRQLRATRLSDFVVAHDPLECLAFDFDLADSLNKLSQELAAGTYRPQPVEVVRSAKKVGLTRPLSFPSVADSLVFRTIVSRAQSELSASSPPWTRFGRDDGAEDDSETPAESGWFRQWLQRQAQLWVITGSNEWLVETDIANFFPYVDVAAIAEHVLANSSLSEDVVRLLELMLRSFAPMRSYRPSRIGGLPQEPFDSSRILAHAYLKPVDEAFSAEGRADRYSRWVDDIVIGSASWQEALQHVRRAQTSLEQLGLYPNAVKTRILRAADFADDYMKEENDYLGVVGDQLDSGVPIARKWFRQRLAAHVKQQARPKAWGRVLRRYYTASRRLEDEYLLRWWPRHLEDSPDSARNILDYLSTFQLTAARLRKLRAVLDRFGGVYEDQELLAREAVCQAPNNGSLVLREACAEWGLDTANACLESNPRLASAAILIVGKFGTDRQLGELGTMFASRMTTDTPARQQALVILMGSGLVSESEIAGLFVQSTPESVQHLQFLISLARGDSRAVGTALSGIEPAQRRGPNRWVVRPRMLFLAPVVASVDPKRWKGVSRVWISRLRSNRLRHRDASAERWFAN